MKILDKSIKDYKKFIIPVILLGFSILIYFLYTKSIYRTFTYNNYSFEYNSSIFEYKEEGKVESLKYLGIQYQRGFLIFKQDQDMINFSLQDQELKPSNALMDIFPIEKNEKQAKFEVDERFDFDFVICDKDIFYDEFECFLVTEKQPNTKFYQGDFQGDNYFQKMINVFGMGWSRVTLKLNDSRYPTQDDIDKFLNFYDIVKNAKKN